MSTNPYFTQYHTQRFSFIGSPQQRDGLATKDQRFINLYPELIKSPISEGKKYYLKKRPGAVLWNMVGAGAGRGCHYWNTTGILYTVFSNTLYANTTPIFTLGTSSGVVGFTEFRTTSLNELILVDGTHGYVITTTNTVTQITDANFPTPHVPTPIYFDGYLFLASSGSQTIHNSTLSDPTTWPADGFIDAEMFPDNIVGLAKVQNYIAAIGTGSIEWFFDNGNSTGSPLQRNAPAVTQFGCPAPSTINQTEQQMIMVASTAAGGRTVWILNGFQPTEIANEPVREALDLEDSGIINATAFTIQCAGHKWYVMNLKTNNRTFVYDFEEQMWHEWQSVGNVFAYDFAADGPGGSPFLVSSQGPGIITLMANMYVDYLGAITCTAITSKIDFDTEKRKRFYRLSLVGDSPNGDTNTPVVVSWSDDDYNTWTGGTILNLNGFYPTITQLGYGRRRAFKFVYAQQYPLRLEAFEVDIIQEVRR